MDARYRRWDGSQDPLAEQVDVADVLERLSGDILNGLGARQALRELLREGFAGRTGADDLARRLRRQRQRLESQIDPESPFAQLRRQLDEIVALERETLAADPGDDARFRELSLDAMPRDPASRFRELAEHDFASPEAGQRFAQLQEQLRRDVLESYFRQLTAGMEQVTPDDLARVRVMLTDLNEMVARRERGEDPRFDEFMAEHGDLFPEDPQTLDELLEVLARRMAAMSRMLAAMSPEQRRQLQELARTVFDDLDMQLELTQLQEQLRAISDHLPWDQPGVAEAGWGAPDEPSTGTDGGPLSRMLDQVERVQELEDLEEQLAAEHAGATLDDVDEEALRRHLGEDAVRDLHRLQAIERELERSGALQRRGGELELSPAGARMLGERALVQLFERVRREPQTRATGADPEPTGQTRPWRFGDREPISVHATVRNAVLRSAQAPRARTGRGVRLRPDDFEVVEHEVRPRTATALLLDLSFSMPLQGHFVPAKRMALALHALISGKHRQDSLHLIGFSDYARRMQPADLGAAGFERVYGTNMQHAFLLARRVLANDPRPVKQVIMVTDGEPTAHLEDEQAVFHWPPIPETLERTLREAMRLARSGISLHIFLLEDAPGLVAFAERLARLTDGQVFRMQGDALGRTILRQYQGMHG